MSLQYEPSLEPLHTSAKQLLLNRELCYTLSTLDLLQRMMAVSLLNEVSVPMQNLPGLGWSAVILVAPLNRSSQGYLTHKKQPPLGTLK